MAGCARANPAVTNGAQLALTGVSCTSATTCTAAGYASYPPVTTRTLAETWNGDRWTITPTPRTVHDGLTAISCAAARACTAIGDYRDGTLIERYS
jgi:hypothetical protein